VRSFTELPATVERLLAGRTDLPGLPDAALGGGDVPERVGVVLLDAFGLRFLERHADHPLLRRIAAEGVITPLGSQFPATTTAHVTTMHTGRPVGEHGLYEWRVYEPALDDVIIPLRYATAGDRDRDTLHARGLDPSALLAGDTLYTRLGSAGVDSVVLQPASFSPSTYDLVAAAGARLRPYDGIEQGAATLREELARPERRYAYLYWDRIDFTGHFEGPDSTAFDREVRAALDALEAALRGDVPGALVLLTADHAQMAVSPARLDDLDVIWPELLEHLSHPPAGSSRDCFLHVLGGHVDAVVNGLAARLGDRAEVRRVGDLVAEGAFGTVGPRLHARLADVCVLPAPGRQAWLRSAAASERVFLGQHGGFHPDEAETWVGALRL